MVWFTKDRAECSGGRTYLLVTPEEDWLPEKTSNQVGEYFDYPRL